MSEDAEHTPLAAVQALESGVFRLGQVLRRVLAEHSGLPIRSFRPSVYVSAYLDEEAETTARVEISARSVDGVRAWAQALGVEPATSINKNGSYAFEHAKCTVVLDGIELDVVGTRRLSDEETAALPDEQDQDADATAGGAR